MHSSKTLPAGWLWTGSVALVVFAARCREVQLFGGDTPYLDQWWVEAHQIIIPWLQGKLSWTDFFRSHHEHIPAWTRLLAWLEAAVLGRWDPQVQCTINAALFGIFTGVWTGWVRRVLPLLPALGLTALSVTLAVLPHGWENSTWGFQSLVPISLMMVVWHTRGAFEQEINSPKWWLAQAAGFGALFTFGSMWSAPAAVALTAWWTSAPGRWRWLAPTLLAILGVVLLLIARAYQPHTGAFAQSAGSIQQFLAAFLLQLGWPSQWPGVAVLMYLPALLLALKLRRNAQAQNIDRVALALALHAAAQATAFAYGRAGGYVGFVSRYGDLLSLGVLANAFALWRLLHGQRAWRPLLVLLTLGWLLAFTQGINWISTRAHTEYFHGHSAGWTTLRRDAVKQYMTNHDAGPLHSEAVRGILYPDPTLVTSVLDEPRLRELLPVSVRPDGARSRGDFISAAALYVRALWPTLLLTGCIVFLIGLGLTASLRITAVVASPEPQVDRWRLRLLAALTALAGLGVFLWPMPLEFRGEKRWSNMLAPPGVVTGLSFLITTPTTYQVDNLTGGASLWPENFRNVFYGTHIDGPGFKGRAQSSAFPIHSPWMVIPFAGFPASEGNSLGLLIEDKSGNTLAELSCPGPNPVDIDFWSADVRSYTGQQARLILQDGRDDEQGWIAVAPPQPAQQAGQAADLSRSWALQKTTIGHDSLGVISLALLFLTLLFAFTDARRSRKINHRATISSL